MVVDDSSTYWGTGRGRCIASMWRRNQEVPFLLWSDWTTFILHAFTRLLPDVPAQPCIHAGENFVTGTVDPLGAQSIVQNALHVFLRRV
jgi:hypothetical protein